MEDYIFLKNERTEKPMETSRSSWPACLTKSNSYDIQVLKKRKRQI